MAKKKKDCTIDEENYNYVLYLQKQECLGSFSAALDFIIKEHKQAENKEEIIADKIIEKLNKDYFNLLTKLRRNINAADINSQIILEVLNTLMINLEITQAYPTRDLKNNALKVGETEVKNKIAYFKQVKDNKQKC